MKNMGFLYIGDYKQDEELFLKEKNIETFRIESFKNPTISQNEFIISNKIIIRGERLSLEEYESLFQQLKGKGLALVNTPDDFKINGSFPLHYAKFKEYSPKAVFFDRTTAAKDIVHSLIQNRFRTPVFVRTDKESAAKYVGFEGCLIHNLTIEELQSCLQNAVQYISNFKVYILKEVEELLTTDSGKKLEYRAIVIEGQVVSFDYEANFPSPDLNGIKPFAENLAKALAAKDMKGAFFVDLAITKFGKIVVVECKDISNGTIKNIGDFANALNY
jgi:hypothetical protein